jgi:Protein of unknown function (DUF3179)
VRNLRGPSSALAASLLLALLFNGACFHSQFRTKPRVAVVGGDPIVQMTAPETLPSLKDPYLSRLKRHTDPPAPWEPVVGLCMGEESRGYPLGLLDRYEVVNDRAEGVEYVVTRCALTQIVAVYDRRVAGRTLTFINSGALWRDTLLIQDRETRTLWTVATGVAIFGPLAGERLRPIPALLATSRAWSRAYPEARYLDTGEPTERPLTISLYAVSPWQGVSGVKTADKRYAPKATLFSVAEGKEVLAFTEEDVKRPGRVEAALAGRPVVLEWDTAHDAPRAFRLEGECTEELAVVPMYWFALNRHFETVRTVGKASGTAK